MKHESTDNEPHIVIDLGAPYGEYLAEDLAFLYMTGQLPKGKVLHLNGDTTDNRWVNLIDSGATVQ
jgi:hypothetical protein